MGNFSISSTHSSRTSPLRTISSSYTTHDKSIRGIESADQRMKPALSGFRQSQDFTGNDTVGQTVIIHLGIIVRVIFRGRFIERIPLFRHRQAIYHDMLDICAVHGLQQPSCALCFLEEIYEMAMGIVDRILIIRRFRRNMYRRNLNYRVRTTGTKHHHLKDPNTYDERKLFFIMLPDAFLIVQDRL